MFTLFCQQGICYEVSELDSEQLGFSKTHVAFRRLPVLNYSEEEGDKGLITLAHDPKCVLVSLPFLPLQSILAIKASKSHTRHIRFSFRYEFQRIY